MTAVKTEPRCQLYILERLRPHLSTIVKHGILICVGKCAGTIKFNVAQCALCHLPNLDPRLDPQRFRPDRHKECVVCEQTIAWADMMLCD
jgi:hypothetical protein